jgi:hypothetical protein
MHENGKYPGFSGRGKAIFLPVGFGGISRLIF